MKIKEYKILVDRDYCSQADNFNKPCKNKVYFGKTEYVGDEHPVEIWKCGKYALPLEEARNICHFHGWVELWEEE